jgi:hypothetical protein
MKEYKFTPTEHIKPILRQSNLIRQLCEHLLLKAAQQKGPQHLVKTANDQNLLFFREIDLLCRASKWRIEPLGGLSDIRKESPMIFNTAEQKALMFPRP